MACNEVYILPCKERKANKILLIFPFTSSYSFVTIKNTIVLFIKKKIPITLMLQTSSFLFYLLLIFVDRHTFSLLLCNQCIYIILKYEFYT